MEQDEWKAGRVYMGPSPSYPIVLWLKGSRYEEARALVIDKDKLWSWTKQYPNGHAYTVNAVHQELSEDEGRILQVAVRLLGRPLDWTEAMQLLGRGGG